MLYDLSDTLYEYSEKDASFFYSRILTEYYLESFKKSFNLICDFIENPSLYPNHKYLTYFKKSELRNRLQRIKKYVNKSWCGSELKFGEVDEEKILLDANFCNSRLCPTCMKRNSLLHFAEISKELEQIYQKHPSANFYFLTLAIQNCSILTLGETLKKLNKARSILFGTAHGKSRDYGMAGVINKHLLGFKAYTEISKGFLKYDKNQIKTDELGFTFDCHPHLHILLVMDKKYTPNNYSDFIPQNSELQQFYQYDNEGWVQFWGDALKEAELYQKNLPTAYIQEIKKDSQNKIDKKAILEVAKYSVKQGDFMPNFYKFSMENGNFLTHNLTENLLLCHDALFLGELSYQIDGYRGISSGGCFRKEKNKNQDGNKEDLVNISKKVNKARAENRSVYRWRSTKSETIGKHYRV